MNKILSYLQYLPKRPMIVFMAIITAVLITATAVAGFGPDRPTKPYEGPGTPGFDHVTFNSFTGVPDIGDERQFYVGKYQGENSWHPTLTQLRAGEEVEMRVYIHNGADPSLNASGAGIARDVNVKVDIPGGTHRNTESRATITSSNAKPTSIWSTVDFAAENGGFFGLDYVEGSATITDRNGTRAISDSLVTPAGVNIGDVPGCFEYAAAIDFKIKIDAPNYRLDKQVAVPGDPWEEDIERKVGEEASWLLTFENKGSTNLDNVVVLDQLPPYNTAKPGSVQLFNANHPDGFTYPDSAIQNNGTQINIDIGTYEPGAIAYIKFKTTIDKDIPDLECNTYRFQNVAYATPEGYSPVNDAAYVYVEGPCNPKPFIECTNLVLDILNKEKREVKATAEVVSRNVEITGYTFNWGDGEVTESETNMAEHTFAEAGKYTVVAVVNYEANGQAGSVECQAKIDFEKPVNPFIECTNLVLNVLNKEHREVKATAEVESRDVVITGYTFDWGDGEVTNSDNNMAEHKFAQAGKYTVTAVVNYEADGEAGSVDCQAMIDFEKPDVPVTPVVPAKHLPNTGAGTILASLFGTGSLAGATHMWVNSRRALKKGLLG